MFFKISLTNDFVVLVCPYLVKIFLCINHTLRTLQSKSDFFLNKKN